MKPTPKAPLYGVAKMHLDTHFNKTAKVLSTRDLKAACGGEGSLETYLHYIKRWQSELLQGSGIMPALYALKHQLQAHTAIFDAMIDQLLRQLTSLGAVVDEIEDIGAADGPDGTQQAAQAPSTENEKAIELPKQAGLSNQPPACDQQISSTAASPSPTDEIASALTAAAPAAADQTRSAVQFDGGQVHLPSSTVPHPAPTDEGPNAVTTAAPSAVVRTRSVDEVDALAGMTAKHAEPHLPFTEDLGSRSVSAEIRREQAESPSAPAPTTATTVDTETISAPASDNGFRGIEPDDWNEAKRRALSCDDGPSARERDRPTGDHSELPLGSTDPIPGREDR